MLHLFYRNLFYKIIFASLISISCLAGELNVQSSTGLLEAIDFLQNLYRNEFESEKKAFSENAKFFDTIDENFKDVQLAPFFKKSILFLSDEKTLSLIQKDECKFYALLENGTLKNHAGNNDIYFTFKNKDGILSNGITNNDIFFRDLYKYQCINNAEYRLLFEPQNLNKTLESLKFPTPKGTNDCKLIHNEWLQNPFTPYICNLSGIVKKNVSNFTQYPKISLTSFQKTYIENLCFNLNSPKDFCSDYLKNDVWNKVLSSEAPLYKMYYKCKNYLKTDEELKIEDLKKCAQKFLIDPKICNTLSNPKYPSTYPFLNCNLISDALLKSKLNTNYQDCPGGVGNDAITNVHRILNHFVPRKLPNTPESCAGEANYSYAKLLFDMKYNDGWPLEICYINKMFNKEECVQYIPGHRDEENLSEDLVIAKILFSQYGAPQKTKCKIVDSKVYNPVRTDYKYGCFIVYDPQSCTTDVCDKKIIWEEREIKDIKYKGIPLVDYYTNTFSTQRYSFTSMINELYGIQSRTVKNITEIKFFLDKTENGIIHGIGCIEDILPEQFKKSTLNQCSPMPFIIDGYFLSDSDTLLTTRLAIDDLHSPRLIMWHNIYNSILAYKALHPLELWTLNALKK